MVHQKLKNPIPIHFTWKAHGCGVCMLLIGIIATLILSFIATWLKWGNTWEWWISAIGAVIGILSIFYMNGILLVLTLLTLAVIFTFLAHVMLFPGWAVTLCNAVIYLLVPIAIIKSAVYIGSKIGRL